MDDKDTTSRVENKINAFIFSPEEPCIFNEEVVKFSASRAKKQVSTSERRGILVFYLLSEAETQQKVKLTCIFPRRSLNSISATTDSSDAKHSVLLFMPQGMLLAEGHRTPEWWLSANCTLPIRQLADGHRQITFLLPSVCQYRAL